ncbi:MAG: DUF401 family protein [Clostridiales bacterium]|jgi:integral membrane protein (TIGR00529 family)|nr:DUF401 family protein [Clostridiales bacterium]
MLGIVAALIAINILSYYGRKLYLSVLAGIILVALFNRFPLDEVFFLFYRSVSSSTSVNLALIIIGLTAFGELFKETGNLRIMVDKLAIVLSDRRHQVVVLPALVGLMAFPGGAVFSAPLVEEAGTGLELDGVKLTVANIMFRHMFYLIFPFYSGLIILSGLSNTNVMFFVRINVLTLIPFFILIYFYTFRNVKHNGKIKADFSQVPSLLLSMSPLLIILVLALGFNIYFPLAILAGIVLAMFNYLPKQSKLSETLKTRVVQLMHGINWSMALSVIFILVLKDFMERSGAIDIIIEFMVKNGVPLIILAIILPFLTGLITGSQTAALGMSAPVFLAGITDPILQRNFLGLVFVTSLAGYMGSPLHLCTVLTAEHFKVSLQQVMRKINLLGLCLAGLGVATFFISIKLF